MASLFPEDFFLTRWPHISQGLDLVGRCSDAGALRASLQAISDDSNFHAARHGKPDFEAVLDDIPESEHFFATLLPKMVQLVQDAPKRFSSKCVPLLVQGIAEHVFLTYEEVATLLAMAFFGLLPNNASISPLYFPKDGCAFPPNTEKLRCFLSYFEDITSDSSAIFTTPSTASGGMRVTRALLGADTTTLQELETNTCRLCQVIPHDLRTPISQSSALLHVDFANARVGGGIFLNAPGATAQEEITFATHPELCIATVLCDVLRDDEALLIQGARHFCRHAGFLDTFSFTGKVHPSEPDFKNAAVQVVIDAKMYDGGGIGRPYRYDYKLLKRISCFDWFCARGFHCSGVST